MSSHRQTHIQFTIPEPCTVSWDGMTIVDKDQKHCSSCDRVITDFSKMSDDELMLYFRHNSGKMCGRFSIHQVNRPFSLLPEKTQKAKWWRTVFLFPLLLFGKSGKAQSVDSVKISHVDAVALSKNEKVDSSHNKVATAKHKKKKSKKSSERESVTLILGNGDNEYILGGFGMLAYPNDYPLNPYSFWDFVFQRQPKCAIEAQDGYRDLTDKKEEPPKPQEPATPSSDPLAGILPEQKKYPWQS